MKKYKIKSYCKINLSLRVYKKLSNNNHNISSVITFSDLHDIITISKIKNSNDQIIFSGRFKKGINNKSNTITDLLHILRKRNFFRNQKFRINIKKNIPHGSGLGGGSANAADLLKFFKSKMKLKLSKIKMKKIAKKIGFDVPIILEKKNVLLTGKRDQVVGLNRKFGLNILIVYPNILCSTKEIYLKNNSFSFSKTKPRVPIKKKSQLLNFLLNERNDLEEAVIKLYPKVKKVINFMKVQNGCYFSRITGSGSACIGIFTNSKTAIFTQKLIKLKFPNYWSAVSKTM